MFVALELWKKNGCIAKTNADAKRIDKYKSKLGTHEVLGFFDNLALTRKESLSDILGYYNEEDLLPFAPYNRYLLPLFSIDGLDSPVGDAPLCQICNPLLKPDEKVNQENDSYIYQITALKVNPEIIKRYEKGMDLFLHIGEEIIACLNENMDSYTPKVSFAVLGGMGAFDFLLITGIKIDDINISQEITMRRNIVVDEKATLDVNTKEINIWHAMQRISAVLRQRRDSENEFHAYFDFSTTFLVCSQTNDFTKTDSPKCTAEIRLSSLHCRKAVPAIQDRLNDSLFEAGLVKKGVKEFDVFHMQGDEDHHVNFKGPLFHLLNMFKPGNVLDINKDDYIREFHTFFLNSEHPILIDDPCFDHKHPEVSDKLSVLHEKYEKVKDYIPFLVQNTVENMIFSCKYMLSSDYQAITGIRMYSLLIDLFYRIEHNSTESETICLAIQDFSYMVPVNLQHHAVRLYDRNGVDWISPISKILYAYEHLITSIQHKMCPEKVSIEYKLLNIFLTIGHTDQIQSKSYFDECVPITSKHLVGFNLPSIVSLAPIHAYSFLVHEAAHYGMLDIGYKNRNESYYKILLAVLEYAIVDESANCGAQIKSADEAVFNELKTFLNSKFNNYDKQSKRLSQFSIELFAAFDEFVTKKIISIQEKIKQGRNILSQDKKQIDSDKYAITIITNIDKEAIRENIENLMQELYADVFMYEICEFTFEQYADLYYSFFVDNKINVMNDDALFYRMGAILLYSMLICSFRTEHPADIPKLAPSFVNTIRSKIQIKKENINKKFENDINNPKYLFLERIFSRIFAHFDTLMELVKLIAAQSLNFPFDEIKSNKLYPTYKNLLSSTDTQIDFFLDHWVLEVQSRNESL